MGKAQKLFLVSYAFMLLMFLEANAFAFWSTKENNIAPSFGVNEGSGKEFFPSNQNIIGDAFRELDVKEDSGTNIYDDIFRIFDEQEESNDVATGTETENFSQVYSSSKWIPATTTSDESDVYFRKFKKHGKQVFFEELHNYHSPFAYEGQLTYSIIIFQKINCVSGEQKITASMFYAGKMGRGESKLNPNQQEWVLNEEQLARYCGD